MRFIVKSIKTALASKQAEETAADKMVGIGKKRRKMVQNIVADSIKQGKTVDQIERKLKRNAKSKKEDWRDWKMVATTEVTDSTARASLELLDDLYGKNALIYRDTRDCCPKCCQEFGPPGKPKHWVLRTVPEELKGAVHPRCKCSPWRSVDKLNVFKAAMYPIGLISRSMVDGAPSYKVSTGSGKWVGLATVTGRYVMRYVLNCIPYVYIGDKDRYIVARHGHGHSINKMIRLIDPNAIGSVSFFSSNPFEYPEEERKEMMMKKRKSFDEYLTIVVNLMPSVVAMPEYWDKPNKMKHLSDFMGYKTLTDWFILIPNKISDKAIIFNERQGVHSVRSAVRQETKRMLFEGDLKKEV